MAVVDCGSYVVRCGYVGDSSPTQYLLPVHFTRQPQSASLCWPRRYTKSELLCDKDVDPLSLAPLWTPAAYASKPDAHFEQLHFITHALLSTEHDPLMLIVPELWHERLDRMAELAGALLEGGTAPSIYLARPSVCWALSQGKPTSIVLDCGHSHSTVAAVSDGYVLRRSILSVPVAGDAVTTSLSSRVDLKYQQTLGHRVAPSIHPAVEAWAIRDALNEVKERGSRVWLPAARSTATAAAIPGEPASSTKYSIQNLLQTFVAPDGSEIVVCDEAGTEPRRGHNKASGVSAREACYEVLFREPPLGVDASSQTCVHLGRHIVRCRRSVGVDLQNPATPFLLCGGTSQALQFQERLLSELRSLDSSFFRAKNIVTASSDGAFVGAAMAAESSAFQQLWISKAEFAEEGRSVLQRKLSY